MDQFEGEILDNAYQEMYMWSGLDTGFIHDMLNAAEDDEAAFLIILRWLRADSAKQKKIEEAHMATYLILPYFSG